MPLAQPAVSPIYAYGELSSLFEPGSYSYQRLHVSTFQTRYNVKLDEAIALAMELPRGAFIAGGFMKSIRHDEPVSEYDIYFRGSENLTRLICGFTLATMEEFDTELLSLLLTSESP